MNFSKKMVLVILIMINVVIFYKLNNNHFNIKYILKPYCGVSNIGDIAVCYKTNPNVVININDIYETGYNHIDNRYVYVDIDISGKTLIGIIKKEDLHNKKIYGYLNSQNDVIIKEIINQIKKDYIDKMEIDNINELFIPLVLNSYNYTNNNIINLMYGSLFILTLTSIIYVSVKLAKERLGE